MSQEEQQLSKDPHEYKGLGTFQQKGKQPSRMKQLAN